MSRPAKLVPRLPTTLSEAVRAYLRPVGLTCGKAAQKLAATGKARRLANGPWFFAACEVVLRAPSKGIKRATAALEDIEAWADTLAATQRDRLRAQLQCLTGPRLAPDGKPLTRPLVMGVIDLASNYDSGDAMRIDPEAAATQGHRLAAAGADLLEVVCPSARHSPNLVSPRAEADLILPLMLGLQDLVGVAISVDTRHPEVAAKALAAGAKMIGDGTTLTGAPESRSATTILRAQQAPAGQTDPAPNGEELVFELFDRLEAQVDAKLAEGIPRAQSIVDPGSGYADDGDGVALMKQIALFHSLGCPILYGLPLDIIAEDQGPTSALHALDQGVQILRTHDLRETRQVRDLWERLIASGK